MGINCIRDAKYADFFWYNELLHQQNFFKSDLISIPQENIPNSSINISELPDCF